MAWRTEAPPTAGTGMRWPLIQQVLSVPTEYALSQEVLRVHEQRMQLPSTQHSVAERSS